MSRKVPPLLTIVRKVFPRVREKTADSLLWCCTAFPAGGDIEFLTKQLQEAKEKGGGTPKGAIKWAHDELDRNMREYNAQKASTK